jgi:hypothetical protein
MESLKWWQRWLDVPIIQVLTRHASGTIVAVVLSWIVTKVVSLCVSDPTTLTRIESVENVVLVGLLVFLVIQLAAVLVKVFWKDLRGGWNGSQILAF